MIYFKSQFTEKQYKGKIEIDIERNSDIIFRTDPKRTIYFAENGEKFEIKYNKWQSTQLSFYLNELVIGGDGKTKIEVEVEGVDSKEKADNFRRAIMKFNKEHEEILI